MKKTFIKAAIYQTGSIIFAAVVISLAVNAVRSKGIDVFSKPDKNGVPESSISRIEPDAMAVKTTDPKILIIDARPESEYAAGHIKGAINLPYNGFDDWIEEFVATVDPGREIITYCSGPLCSQASEVAELLLQMGYKNISYFSGGMEQWRAGNLPVEID